MLKTLQIKDFALIENVLLEFSPNLNIITGETGAGKSIIVDALMLALGERGSSDLVRKGSKKAAIECVFSFPVSHPVFNQLEKNEYDIFDNEVIIRREISAKGVSRCFLNDTPIPVNSLKEFGDILVDFHGQHDHQILLKSKYHIDIIDGLSNTENDLVQYKKSYEKLKELVSEYNDLKNKEAELKRSAQHKQFELDEITKINPEKDEEKKIENELKIFENSEILLTLANEVFSKLYENESSAHEKISEAEESIKKLSEIDDKFSVYVQECKSALIAIDEIAKFAKDYSSDIEFDPEKTEKLRERAYELKGLRKKYGTFDAIFERKNELEKELSLINNYDSELKKLKESILAQKEQLAKSAQKIHDKRKKTSVKFSEDIINKLHILGITKADFEVKIDKEEVKESDICDIAIKIGKKNYRAYSNGIDKAEFIISTNPGEPKKPLSKIASGGEISRVMLAIKSIIAESDDLPILVFDEIDTGISGRIAQIVGQEMRDLSVKHQIISITHLPQIAAMANRNIRIEKLEKNGKSVINGYILDKKESLEEVAKLISGTEVTNASLESARELMKNKLFFDR